MIDYGHRPHYIVFFPIYKTKNGYMPLPILDTPLTTIPIFGEIMYYMILTFYTIILCANSIPTLHKIVIPFLPTTKIVILPLTIY